MALSNTAVSVSELVASCLRSTRYRWRHGIGSSSETRRSYFADLIQGLCISGGPDSMALAALFSKIKRKNFDFPFSPTTAFPLGTVYAFIVDHQAREGSAEEARVVAHRLKSLGTHYAAPRSKNAC